VRVLTVPASGVLPDERMVRGRPDAFFWQGRDGARAVGIGVAARASVTSATDAAPGEHILDARRAVDELWSRVEIVPAAAETPRPRLYGGFAFAAGWRDRDAWDEFPDADFVLPRCAWVTDGGRTYVSVAIPDDEADCPATPPPLSGGETSVRRLSGSDRTAWIRHVQRIQAAIAAGSFEKIVAARRTVFEVSGLDGVAVASRLAASEGDRTFRFLVARRGAAIVGATPERLVRRIGPEVLTEALAGSIAAGSPSTMHALLARGKDRAEHEIVAREIARCLAPRCAAVEVAAEPEVRALRHVAHLWTPIRARLRAGVDGHVLALAHALHPTPAVGGAPGAAAAAWIREHEATPRGWYAGAVGWLDDAGDGELAVALRCGVLARGRAYVYAGAGIVAASDPSAEHDETELKQRAFLRALDGGDGER
jgi:isochorismate synthase